MSLRKPILTGVLAVILSALALFVVVIGTVEGINLRYQMGRGDYFVVAHWRLYPNYGPLVGAAVLIFAAGFLWQQRGLRRG